MARKTTTFSIEGREKPIELRELTVRDVISLLEEGESESKDDSLGGFKVLFQKFLPRCSNLEKIEDLYDIAPSDIEKIWEKFKEVNSVFLRVSQQLGMNKLLGDFKERILEAIIKDFGKVLADSLKEATQESSTTDIPIS